MRKLLTSIAFIASASLTTGAAYSASDLSSMLEPIRQEHGLPALAAAVVKDGEVIAAGAVGTRVDGLDIPVTVEDRFHIGSDTKAMTATIAGTLVDEGLLRWDSTVGEVLGEDVPGMSEALQAVTVEQLLSHSSGIPSDTPEMMALYFNTDAFEDNPDQLRLRVIDAWKANEPVVPSPGSPFQYANFGYIIVGAMIEKLLDKPWEQVIHERIFTPLGLTSAGLGPQATFGLYDAPVGHRLNADGSITPMAWGAAADIPAVMGPAGNVHMSITDLARWGGWNAQKGTAEPQIVTEETLAEIQRPHVQTPPSPNAAPGTSADGQYALGWSVVKFDWSDYPLLTHNGSNGMNLAKILVDTNTGLAIAVAINMPGPEATAALNEVVEELYGQYNH